MKSLELLAGLDKRESKHFESVMKMHKRSSLQNVFHFLARALKSGKKVEKEPLFKAVFEEPYSPDKDYVLRNELRLFNEELRAFLVQREFEYECAANANLRNSWLLKALRRRRMDAVFDATYNSVLDKSAKDADYINLAEMLRLKIVQLSTERERSEPTIREIEELNQKQLEVLTRALVRRYREIQLHSQFVHEELGKLGLDPEPVDISESVDLSDKSFNDEYSFATYHAARSLVETGDARLKHTRIAYDYLKDCTIPGVNQPLKLLILTTSLATEYHHRGELEGARRHFGHMLELSEHHGIPLSDSSLYNYFSFLLSTAQYPRAIELFKESVAAGRVKSKQLYGLQCKTGMCYIMLGEAEQALRHIDHELHSRNPVIRYTTRFSQICASYLLRDYDNALRESTNLSKTILYHENRDEEEEVLLATARFYCEFFEALFELDPRKQSRLHALHEQLEVYVEGLPFVLTMHVPLTWIRREVKTSLMDR